MSREEHLRELVRQGQALRQEDIDLGAKQERERIIKLLTDLDVIRRDFFDQLVAFNTDGTEVVYLTGLEGINTKVSGGDFPTDSTGSTLPISQGKK